MDWTAALLTVFGSAGGAWVAVRVEIHFMKRAIEAAHDRLDKIGAPPARVRL